MIKLIDFDNLNFDDRNEVESIKKSYFETQLDKFNNSPEEFTKNRVFIHNRIDFEISAIKELVKQYGVKIKRLEKKQQFHKDITQAILETTEDKVIKNEFGKISYRKSVKVITEEDFDVKEYITIKEVESIDKNKIKEDLKADKVIKGAWLENNNNLQIKA